MNNEIIEAKYPIEFRAIDAKQLGEYLRQRNSVDLVGMRRVGISNFLRFFLYHQDVVRTYITGNGETHIFIPVDLNDLIERELFPFWILLFKRIVDTVETESSVNAETKKLASRLFLDAIQSNDMFLTFDGIRKTLTELSRQDIFPTIFLIRFDRMKEAVTPEFFGNLQGLVDATAGKLSYVFTSFRTLHELVPSVFTKESLSVFSQSMYIKPADRKDAAVIFDTFKKRYQIDVDKKTEDEILSLAGGHVQYLQLSLIILKESLQEVLQKKIDIRTLILQDERTALQSEELWESLNDEEKNTLLEILKNENVKGEENGRYLWESGIVSDANRKHGIFSPIFNEFLLQKAKLLQNHTNLEFTKKEHILFTYLKENVDVICDRENIIATVWPEYEELGVSDWAVDRLIARVRAKLKDSNNPYEIVTIKTRGYKLSAK